MSALDFAWRVLKEDDETRRLPSIEELQELLNRKKNIPNAIQMNWINHRIMDAHPDKIFLFGDNNQRRGMGGQAKHMRGHPQAVGIRTKHAPSMHPSAMWTDDTYDDNVRMINEDIQQAKSHNKQIVIPSAGIGTGLAKLNQNAPRTFAYLQEQLQALMGDEE